LVATISTSSSPASTGIEPRSVGALPSSLWPSLTAPAAPWPANSRTAASNDGRLSDLQIRYRANFAYVAGATIDDHDPQPLFRLRYLGSPHHWGFAIYLASKDGYEDSILPAGRFTGSAAETLDCACGLYLNDTTAWTEAESDSRENF
jgi:hypothetical protein